MGNWRMQWVASTLHTTSEHGVSSITTADAHTSAASSRLNWRLSADLNGLVRFAHKTKFVSCGCAITFQLASVIYRDNLVYWLRYQLYDSDTGFDSLTKIFLSSPRCPFNCGAHLVFYVMEVQLPSPGHFHLYSAPSLKISGGIPPLSHTPWRCHT